MAGQRDNPAKPTPPQPVIVNSSLANTEFLRQIKSQHHLKIRTTDSTVKDSVIFPRSGVAYLILPLNNFPTSTRPDQNQRLDIEAIQRIDKMVQVHRNLYILLVAPLHNQPEMAIMTQLQMRFIGRPINMIPCHNAPEVVQVMLDIAKMSGKTEPAAALIRGRLEAQLAKVLEPISPLMQIGLSDHDTHVLLDSLRSGRRILSASEEELSDTCLDKDTVAKVIDFLRNDQRPQ